MNCPPTRFPLKTKRARALLRAQARRFVFARGARFFEGHPAHELGGEHALARAGGDERGDPDGGIARVHFGEVADALGFELVVELLAEPLLDDGEDVLGLEFPRATHGGEGLQDRRVGQVALDRPPDSRVLHLDGDLEPVVEPRAVHLADRRAGDGELVPLGEELRDGGAEVLLDGGADCRGGRRGRLRAEGGQGRLVGLPVVLGDDAVHVACHLPDLRGETAERAERLGSLLCRAASVAIEEEPGARADARGGEPREPGEAALGELPFVGHVRRSSL